MYSVSSSGLSANTEKKMADYVLDYLVVARVISPYWLEVGVNPPPAHHSLFTFFKFSL